MSLHMSLQSIYRKLLAPWVIISLCAEIKAVDIDRAHRVGGLTHLKLQWLLIGIHLEYTHGQTKWFVTFNPNKSEALLISRKHNRPYHPPICTNSQPITEVSHKHLGIILSNDCTWHAHFELLKAKAWSRINVMRKLKFQLDRKSLQIIFFFFHLYDPFSNTVMSFGTTVRNTKLTN